nr:MAG TPA: hypothetical protein [Caudoviricetes sp.]
MNEEESMFYANIDTLKFCTPDSPEKAGDKPQFRHTESKSIDITFLRGDGTPLNLTGATLTLALDSNYYHWDKLTAFSEGDKVQILNPGGGVVRFFVDCNSAKFAQLVQCGSSTVKMEIVMIAAGETEERTLLHDDGIRLLPRVHTSEGAPADASPDYYSKAQIDALMQSNTRVELAACTGMGIRRTDEGTLMTWIDPDDVTLNGSVLARWDRTVLVRKEGSYPENSEDGEIIAETSRADATKNKYRSDGFHDAEREAGTTYFYKLFSQATGGVWNNQDANRYAETTSMSWGMVQSFVRAGRGPELWPVGTVFVVDHPEYTHADGTGLWFRVVGHDQMQAADETLTHSMCLDMVDCLFNAPYDVAEALYALTADETAQELKTYYTLSGTEYIALVEGTDYNIGDPVPVASWYEKNFDIRATGGSNNAIQSNMIQWANSDGKAGEWYSPTTIFDTCSSALLNRNGFLRYIDPEFLDIVKPAKLITAKSNPEGGDAFIHQAKFWALSRSQVSGLANNAITENAYLEYYSGGGSRIKYLKDTATPQGYVLRSPIVGSSCDEQCVLNQGDLNSYASGNSFGYTLACIIA